MNILKTASSVERFFMLVCEDFRHSINIAEYMYINPKKSMRGANSVSFVDVDKKRVISEA